jgi:hypothetical protein
MRKHAGQKRITVRHRVDDLAKARRVDCYAVGNTSIFIASDAQARFSRLGLNSNFYFDAYLQLVSAATMTKSDVVLARVALTRSATLAGDSAAAGRQLAELQATDLRFVSQQARRAAEALHPPRGRSSRTRGG